MSVKYLLTVNTMLIVLSTITIPSFSYSDLNFINIIKAYEQSSIKDLYLLHTTVYN
ncbi:hypothetical protein SAMN05216524_105151 [Mucilaginibacter sp. OK098]|nr:hypothetical protein SAMN05216524_105151 [Mucilaginibacter sp. OK098]